MFVKINETEWINLELTGAIYLEEEVNRKKDKDEFPCVYRFVFSTPARILCSKPFKTKEEATQWFREEIEPVVKDYNDAKFSLIDLNHLQTMALHFNELQEKK